MSCRSGNLVVLIIYALIQVRVATGVSDVGHVRRSIQQLATESSDMARRAARNVMPDDVNTQLPAYVRIYAYM